MTDPTSADYPPPDEMRDRLIETLAAPSPFMDKLFRAKSVELPYTLTDDDIGKTLYLHTAPHATS